MPAQTRMRQIFMTGLSACIGLVPAAFSTGIGSQVQQPLAWVIVGGMLLSPICSLLVIPVFARLMMPDVPGTAVAASSGAAGSREDRGRDGRVASNLKSPLQRTPATVALGMVD